MELFAIRDKLMWRIRVATVVCAASALTYASTAQTLQQQLELAIQQFSGGNYFATHAQFESMAADYGRAAEFLAADFQSKILPARGYAALLADQPADALVHFSTLLQSHKPSPSVRAFALYHTALAQSQTGARTGAAATFQLFQQSFPTSKEAILAQLQQANLRAKMGEHTAANLLLDTIYNSSAPQPLRMKARLTALQLAISLKNTDRLQQLILETKWPLDSMTAIAALSLAALQAGDLLLADGKFDLALRAYKLTVPLKPLIEEQSKRLKLAKWKLTQLPQYSSSIWKSHSHQQVAHLRNQVEQLKSIQDYSPGLHIRMGQSYLLLQRYYEATLLFRSIAQTESLESSTRAEAHYRWALTLTESKRWDAAQQCASDFLRQYPQHRLANQTLFLIARSYQKQADYEKSIHVLDQLIEQQPGDSQAVMWYFSRGYNYCALEQQSQARDSFQSALSKFPTAPLTPKIRLWYALSYFFDREYVTSLNLLEVLSLDSTNHALLPEIQFRIANVFYAQREYHLALASVDALITSAPQHDRFAAAVALRGDIHMGLGQLPQAIQAFEQVPTDATKIYDYAIFQTSKIHKTLGQYHLMQQQLQRYVDRNDATNRPRVSEALYWIGWSLQQQGQNQAALPIFEAALDRFGNDPNAHAVGSILAAYAQLTQRVQQEKSNPQASFKRWLKTTSSRALAAGQLTRFARIQTFTAKQQRSQISQASADATLLAIHRFVPLQAQDPDTLAQVGILLAQRGYDSADDYFEYLLRQYSERFERGAAYYGKAKLAAQKEALPQAQRWLARFMQETPTHPLAAEARLLSASILTTQGSYLAAQDILKQILALQQLRGRPHARALAQLAGIESQQANPKRAIPYWQRIYTLYRAYPELTAQAYWQSAQLFCTIGDQLAACNTLEEMLRDPRLRPFADYASAKAALPQIRAAAAAAQSQSAQNLPAQIGG